MSEFGRSLDEQASLFHGLAQAIPHSLQSLRASARARLESRYATAEREVRATVAAAFGNELADYPGEDGARRRAFLPLDAAAADWSDSVWDRFDTERLLVIPPPLVRAGWAVDSLRLNAAGEAKHFAVPAFLPMFGGRNLLFRASGTGQDKAHGLVQALLLRLVASMAPGTLRMTLVDPVGMGNRFSEITPFSETVRGPKVWHEQKEIQEELSRLTDQMGMVIQKCLKSDYKDIDAYNGDADVKQPYSVLAVAGFPVGFTADSFRQLQRIVQQGPRVGLMTIIVYNVAEQLPHGANITDLLAHCAIVGEKGAAFVLPTAGQELILQPDGPPPSDRRIGQKLAERVNSAATEAMRVEVPFAGFVDDNQFWKGDSSTGLSVALGRIGARDDLVVELGVERAEKPYYNVLVGGGVGSGKTVFLKALVTSLCLKYPPEELELYLVDFKEGVDFEPFRSIPHARVVALESEREFGVSILRGLDAEIKSRGNLFRGTGEKIALYRKNTGRRLPRVVLVIDEFQKLFERTDKLATEARALLDNIARTGRSFGVHIVLATQSLAGVEIEPATLNQISLRVAFRMAESDSLRILSKENPAARDLTRAGQAIFNDGGGLEQHNTPCQIALLKAEELPGYVASMSARAAGRAPRIFEGNKPGAIEKNARLAEVLATPPTVAPTRSPIYLGEPVSLDDEHTSYTLRSQGGANVLMAGNSAEPMAFATFLSALLSWMAVRPRGSGRVLAAAVLNWGAFDQVLPDLPPEFSDNPLYLVDRLARENARTGTTEIAAIGFIREAAENVRSRLAQEPAGRSRPKHEPVLLAIFGLNRLRKLWKEGLTSPAETKELVHVLADGPERNVHSLLRVETSASLAKILETRDLGSIDARVAFAGVDSGKILDDHGMSFAVREQYGVLYDRNVPQELRKFKCYDLNHTLAYFEARS